MTILKKLYKGNFKRSTLVIFTTVCQYFSLFELHFLKKYPLAPNSPRFKRKTKRTCSDKDFYFHAFNEKVTSPFDAQS